MIEVYYLAALIASAASGARYQVYGRKKYGYWKYRIAPTFQASRYSPSHRLPMLAVAAPESKTPGQGQPY